jgi:hypothetical protein
MKIFKLIVPLFLICCNSPSNEDNHPHKTKEIKYSVDLNIIEDFMNGGDTKHIKSELLKKDYDYRGAGQVYLGDTLQYYIVDMQERIIVSRHYTHFEQLAKVDTNHFPYYTAQFHSLYLEKPNQLLIESNNTNKDSLNGMYFTKNEFAYIIFPRRMTIYKTQSDAYVEFADIVNKNEDKLILLNRALELDKDNEEARRMQDSLLSK